MTNKQWTSYTHSHSPYILYTPRSRCRYPIGTTSPWTQEVVLFPPGVETGRPLQHLNLVWGSPGSCLNLRDPGPDPDPSPQPPPFLIRGGGDMQKRGPHGPNKPTNQSRHRIK
ncbi:hypothetical protein ILYODFUR_024866 [Ilyodon furcidens]|uniref:Uncharacterized protein n=1 Tax=Ilyodon furcidens TaxID=33524 RepID=A0ABV0TCP5_9TELE